MNTEEAGILQALHDDPLDATSWLVLADWLEETGQDERAELVRVWHALRADPVPALQARRETTLRDLLARGVRPCGPTLINSLGMRFALVPAGSFWMGAPEDEDNHFHDELPPHPVTLRRSFYLGIHPVTQEQYQRLLGHNPSHFCASGRGRSAVPGLDTRRFPVERITWDDAVAFCARLSDSPEERRAGRVYRLPTEAEWEYACRGAGTSTTPFSFGTAISARLVNFDSRFPYGDSAGPYLERPQPVGTYLPNVLGLHEMHGNIWELCADWFDEGYYERSPSVDPHGPSRGEHHVLRGGSWYSTGRVCRSACRNAAASKESTGFRVVLCVEGFSKSTL
jgi:uncharacterized protein (TIGR02996 family)